MLCCRFLLFCFKGQETRAFIMKITIIYYYVSMFLFWFLFLFPLCSQFMASSVSHHSPPIQYMHSTRLNLNNFGEINQNSTEINAINELLKNQRLSHQLLGVRLTLPFENRHNYTLSLSLNFEVMTMEIMLYVMPSAISYHISTERRYPHIKLTLHHSACYQLSYTMPNKRHGSKQLK